MPDTKAPPPRRALVVFGDRADLAWLKILKRGFRHCFAVIEGGQGGGVPVWVIYNPLSHCTDITTVVGSTASDLADHYRNLGFRVVETRITRPIKRTAPWRPYTCVEAVKRVLGLRAPGVFTPRNLHNFLISENKRK